MLLKELLAEEKEKRDDFIAQAEDADLKERATKYERLSSLRSNKKRRLNTPGRKVPKGSRVNSMYFNN